MSCQGSVLTLHGVTRAASGVYMCRADNGVGQPATDKVRPEIASELQFRSEDLQSFIAVKLERCRDTEL